MSVWPPENTVLKRAAGLILLGLYLYTSILMGGGRGPFALYSEYWTCQCNDFSWEDAPSHINNEEIPALRITDAIPQHSDRISDAQIESALQNLASQTADEDTDICRKKIPLRYMNLIQGNNLAYMPPILPDCCIPELIILSVFRNLNEKTISGIPVPLLRPPSSV